MRTVQIGSASRSNISRGGFQNPKAAVVRIFCHSLVTGDCHDIVPNNAACIAPDLHRGIDGRRSVVGSRGIRIARPGGGQGTASSFTQLAMAILVYGGSALLIGTGLIGAMRRR
jgi:hypothetical protein